MIKIRKAKNGQLYFVVLAKNNKVLVTSETYKSRAGIDKGIQALLGVCYGSTTRIIDETAKPAKKKK